MSRAPSIPAALFACTAVVLAACGGGTTTRPEPDPEARQAVITPEAPSDGSHVTHLTATQSGREVVIEYDLEGPQDEEATVQVEASRDGGRTWQTPEGRWGDAGEVVPVGTGKRAVWTVLDDHPDGLHTDLRLRVQTAHELTRPTSLQPGQVFRDRLADGSEGPEMVVIPAGTFRMEDIQGGGDSDEKPVHRVTLAQPFAMGRYEVINAEFVRFLKAVGRRGPSDAPWFETHPEDGDSRITGSSGRFSVQSDYEDHPVVEVSWYGATAYANWLSEQTGKHYRLPTEAEWEHAARAGTQTKYWWGNVIGRGRANCYGCGGQWDGKALAPVGSFAANPFRLHDMVGNVWEWTCSAYTSDYDGSEATCSGKNHADARVLRGGGWTYVPRGVRSANRYKWSPGARGANLGFRLAQGS